MREIIVDFDADGDGVQIQTKGFEGDQCLRATESLKRTLGLTVEETPTEEMYQTTANALTQGQ